MWYENEYGTKIEEVGCIKHGVYDFIGASPDGINIKYENDRYGRLLEIKNPVTRVLTGIPKMEYWVQMQIQMEVWGIDTVDFLETAFKEYDDVHDFDNDGTFQKTKDNKLKGIILQFDDLKYEYCPIGYTKQEFEKWSDDMIENYDKQSISWMQNKYWKLDDISCILVTRNNEWFKSALPYFKKYWDIILNERITGYEHRKPKKRKSGNTLMGDVVDKFPKQTNGANVFKIETEALDRTT
jgi:hypothetical protein